MNSGYKSIDREPFPNAKIVIDRFHIVQLVNRAFSNFKAKILLVFSLFTPSETNKKPRYSKEERQDILDKKKEIRLKRKNRKKAILLNIAGCILNPGHGKMVLCQIRLILKIRRKLCYIK